MAEGGDADFVPSKKPCFAVFSDDEIKKKQFKQIPKNTLKSEKNADTIFMKYLQEQENILNMDYTVYPDDELDKILVKFWFSLRKTSGEKYLISILQNIKNALNHNLQRRGRNLDISTDGRYVNSQRAFKDACCELKSEGFGHVRSFPEIEEKGTNFQQDLDRNNSILWPGIAMKVTQMRYSNPAIF